VWQVGVKVWGGDSASEAGTGVANGWLEHVQTSVSSSSLTISSLRSPIMGSWR
jgi:hypothetical protein